MADENITQHLIGFNYLNQSQLTNLTMIGWDKRNLSHAPGKPWEALKFAVGAGNVLIRPAELPRGGGGRGGKLPRAPNLRGPPNIFWTLSFCRNED